MIEMNPPNACEDPMTTSPSTVIVLETIASVEPLCQMMCGGLEEAFYWKKGQNEIALGTVIVNVPATPDH